MKMKKDLVGILLSLLCIVHCLLPALLMLLGAAGMLSWWWTSEWVHYLLLAPIVLVLLLSLPASYRQHQQKLPLLLAAAGLSLLLLSLVLPEQFEAMLAVSGGLLLASAHGYNRHLYRRCQQRALQPLSL
jgi:hypothetical protein